MFVPTFAAASSYVVASFVGYLVLMLAIGAVFSGKMKNLGDYYLGGRRMNKWVVALSAQASDMSGWLLMGLPGAVYLAGFSEAWIGIGLGIGTYLNWKIVAHRLRQYSKACGDSITIPDFISNRFRDRTGASRMVAAAIILAFFLFYTASGFVAAAKLFVSMFGMEYSTALWIGAAVVVSYTLLGGYMAVCWTDFIQGSLMFLAIVIVPACVIGAAGGFSATVDQLNAVNPYLQNLFTSASTKEAMGIIGLVSCLAWGLGYFGMPHILVRFMSIDNPAEVKGSRRIAMAWVFISLGAAVVIGLVGHLFLKQHPGVALDDPEKVFMVMINTIFANGVVAKLFAGILLSAIMAAIMSTADSQLLVSASAFTNDLYKRVLHKDASNRELVLVSRLAVAAVAVIAAVICSPETVSAPRIGTVEYEVAADQYFSFDDETGKGAVVEDGLSIRIVDEGGAQSESIELPKGAVLFFESGAIVKPGDQIAEVVESAAAEAASEEPAAAEVASEEPAAASAVAEEPAETGESAETKDAAVARTNWSAPCGGKVEYVGPSVDRCLEFDEKTGEGTVKGVGLRVSVAGEDGKKSEAIDLPQEATLFFKPGDTVEKGVRLAMFNSDFFKVVMKMVSFAWGGFGAAFGPLILLALFWRRTNLAGAVAGMAVGAGTCFLWKFWLAPAYAAAHPFFGIYELAPGFVLSLVTIVVVSLLTKKPSQEILDEYDRVNALPEAQD